MAWHGALKALVVTFPFRGSDSELNELTERLTIKYIQDNSLILW